MKKNVAGQKVCCQLTKASDGTEFAGSVTVYVLGDAGTQALGSVGSGACASEGHGVYSYAPAQAETNYDNVMFTFVGTGAITSSVQFEPQPVSVFNETLETGLTIKEALKLITALASGDMVLDPVTGAHTFKSRDGTLDRITSSNSTVGRVVSAIDVS